MKWRGFTLVELLVTIAIMGLLIAVSIPAFRTYNEENRLRLAAEEVRDSIVEARSLALAPRTGDVDNGYKATINSTDNTFKVLTTGNNVVREKVLPEGITFNSSQTIEFKITDRGRTTSDVIVILRGAGGQKSIIVSQGGDVAVKD